MKTLIETTPTGGKIYRLSDSRLEARPANSNYFFPCTSMTAARLACDEPETRCVTDDVIGKRFYDMREEVVE